MDSETVEGLVGSFQMTKAHLAHDEQRVRLDLRIGVLAVLLR